VRDDDRAALERMHTILDASQRAKFVDALQARFEANKGEHKGHHGEMKQWAEDLKLTDAQRSQIKDAMRAQWKSAHAGGEQGEGHPVTEMKAHKQNAQKVLEAFKGDRFVMDEVSPKKDTHAMATKMSGHMIQMAETVMPILTPEQRTIAAQKLRTHSIEATEIHAPF
jgi:Spy/CpxP family protein refolding chaperone